MEASATSGGAAGAVDGKMIGLPVILCAQVLLAASA